MLLTIQYTNIPRGPPEHGTWHSFESLLQVNEGQVEVTVLGKVLLLQLANNKYCVDGTLVWLKTKLHIINADCTLCTFFHYPLKHLHHLVQ